MGRLNKKEFIEKYGKEAWEEKSKRELVSKRNYKKRNREKLRENSKMYYAGHKEQKKKERQDYDKTQPGRASRMVGYLRQYDKNAGRGETTITKMWILENIFTSHCVYCGETDWRKLGCDRIDNNLPHTPENCVCSCGTCNVERGDRWSVEEFIEYKRLKGDPELGHPAS